MPIVSSRIISKRTQRNGQIKIHESFIDSLGTEHRHFYVAPLGTTDERIDINLADRVPHRNERLKEQEIIRYLKRIENGENIIGLNYQENTQAERVIEFLKWTKQKVIERNPNALAYAVKIIDGFSVVQIDSLLGVGKGDKVKALVIKIKDVLVSIDESLLIAEDI